MSDEELIALHKDMMIGVEAGYHYPPKVAQMMHDRIEALIAERDEAINQLDSARHSVDVLEKRCRTLIAERATCEKYRDAYAEMGRTGTQAVRDLEAKLAKAAGALSLCAGHDHDCVSKIQIARATLAEIKGESHE